MYANVILMMRFYLEILASLVVAAFFGTGFLKSLEFDGASAYMPAASCAVATAMALLWLIRHLLSARRRAFAEDDDRNAPQESAIQNLSTRTRAIRTVAILLLAGVFAGLIQTVGLVTMTFLFVLVGSSCLGASWRAALTAAACFAAVVYIVFGVFLQLALPPEALFAWVVGR